MIRAVVGASALALSFTSHCAADEARSVGRLHALVNRLSPDTMRSADALGAAFSVKLTTSDANGSFAFFEAREVIVEGIRIAPVDYRMPQPGGGATAGPILVLEVDMKATACIAKQDVLRAYPDLTPDGPPSPHATDPDAYHSQRDGQARLSFGFPAFGPNCLRTLVYSFDAPLMSK